ncbi:hypothetical protein [Acinetobacter gerneri]|uniref:Bacteriophage protein n=1 Tax=Acinetobacter gerneri DSM 14967 = CIP 107464 = MTCC 9824 TaxID=1120926 RepID=N8YB93_9GAMM|nr:hypothetical protein [Acinetobacter gerneri]ENV33926.1 hypothetical protein F960_01932 [Acinetobacter gerneri DSM 14967 = CIP 107464 = MTCC 9824]EPR82803.1 hypothetical protein L289_2721 [Acinetobacter gerneri DSM 14967 = CIP 107464 = MTCC 9824]
MSSILNQSGRQTPCRELGLIGVPVKAGAVLLAGFAAVVDESGYAVAASASAKLTYLGRYEEAVDNTSGGNGDVYVLVRTDSAFQFENSATDPVTQASFGKVCYLQDGETVAATDGMGKLSKAGRVVGIDENGVWVE